MFKSLVRSQIVFVFAAILTLPLIVSAQANRTWVSGVGDDMSACSRAAPCRTFAGAILKTNLAGEINVLDPGGYGGVTIGKSITIDGTGTVGSILAGGNHGILIQFDRSEEDCAAPRPIVERNGDCNRWHQNNFWWAGIY